MVNINVLHVAYTLKVLVPELMKRVSRSAVVITSSTASEAPMPGASLYCASKAFESYLGRALNYELSDKIEVLSFAPGTVNTNALDENHKDWSTISPERAADVCFRDIGQTAQTTGDWKHEVDKFFLSLTPTWLLNPEAFKATSEMYRARRQKEKSL